MSSYFVVYKPFQVLTQFSAAQGKPTLKDFFSVPGDIYPVGRLDYDSEGLLILTNDATINHRLLDPAFGHQREYLVQVEGDITAEAIAQLSLGIFISVNGKPYRTQPGSVMKFSRPPIVPERYPPIRVRKNIPTSWIRLAIREGKNRQVRKMTAGAGFPTLRLIRYRIERLTVEGISPGEMISLTRKQLYEQLFNSDTP